ncbi:MAG: 2-dehydro-3-deoxygalactonokinase [Treponema sp.]|nr:2-dehydro-3-deoxygalactonokinase [Treponema sp.]
MYKVYFDSGTTNSRIYVIDDSGTLIRTTKKAVGSKDTVLKNDKQYLVRELYALYSSTLADLHIDDSQVSSIWLSGMVTSKNGIVEVPYVAIPVTPSILADNIFEYDETTYFCRKLFFIPGIKSVPKGISIDFSNVDLVNNMRGEETEIMGILSKGIAQKDTCAIVLPGSHTQIAVLQDGAIVHIISSITGELYKAIKEQTILSEGLVPLDTSVDEEMVILGYKNLSTYGFNRALYIVRTLLLFTKATDYQRSSYLEGVINGGVLQAIQAVLGKTTKVNIFLAGGSSQYQIYSTIAKQYYPQYTIHQIEEEADAPFSLLGFKSIAACYHC